ncbi:MAG: hypothetical protein U0P30_15585 [Vicinamibacterales bacterium]
MDDIHGIMRGMPPPVFGLVVIIPLAMAAGAVILGWEARNIARKRQADAAPGARGPESDALAAAITVAMVPFAFALLMLWGRFG